MPQKCQCLTVKGDPCRNNAKAGSQFCGVHVHCKKSMTTASSSPRSSPKKSVSSAPHANVSKKATVFAKPTEFGLYDMDSDAQDLAAIWALREAAGSPMKGRWFEDLPDRYFLTMADVAALSSMPIGSGGALIIAPPTYGKMQILPAQDEELSDFYEQDGKAVTGTLASPWVTYRPGLEAELIRIREKYVG